MRGAGALGAPDGPPGTHACWPFEDDGAFSEAAVGFLSAGAARGDRLLYVGDATPDEAHTALAPLGDVDQMVGGGALLLAPVGDVYPDPGRFDGPAQVRTYQRLVAEAHRDGYRGLCVAADATSLVTTVPARRRFVEYELAVDRLMAGGAMSALCAYDRRVVGSGLSELFAVHPAHHDARGDEPGFRAFHADGAVRLTGEVDLHDELLFAVVVEALLGDAGPQPVLDLTGLEFIDVRGLALLGELATGLAGGGVPLQIRSAPHSVRRCADLLALDDLVLALVAR